MENDQLNLLIDKKIADAKLEAADKRIHYIMVIGVILPIFLAIDSRNDSREKVKDAIASINQDFQKMELDEQSYESTIDQKITEYNESQSQLMKDNSAKIDYSIIRMQNQFKELAGTQLRKPMVECYYNGRPLEGSTITFKTSEIGRSIEMRNIGDGSIKSYRVKMYTTAKTSYGIYSDEVGWSRLESNDEPTYKNCYASDDIFHNIDPKESNELSFRISVTEAQKDEFDVLLKVFYEQPEPKIFSFKIILDGTN